MNDITKQLETEKNAGVMTYKGGDYENAVCILSAGDDMSEYAAKLFYNLRVVEELEDFIRNNYARIRPANTHKIAAAVLSLWSNAWIAAFFMLRVTHIAHPLAEECARVGVEGTCLAENLRVSRPAEPLIALRAVGRN